MKHLYLAGSTELFAIVDDKDYALLKERKWYLSVHGYAVSTVHRKGCGRTSDNRNINTAMHRFIMNAPLGFFIDHINGNRLDNRRSNLRIVSAKENCWNRRAKTEGYIGVSKAKSGKWRVRVDATQYGEYEDAVTAALVYDHVVRLLRGPIATNNFPRKRLPKNVVIPNLTSPVRKACKQSGVSGVVWHTGRDKWRVIVDQKSYGYFDSLKEAIALRRQL